MLSHTPVLILLEKNISNKTCKQAGNGLPCCLQDVLARFKESHSNMEDLSNGGWRKKTTAMQLQL